MQIELLVPAGLAMVVSMSPTLFDLLADRPRNLGVENGRLALCPSRPNCVSSQAQDASHQVEPIAVCGDPHAALNTLAAVVEKMGGARIVRRDRGYLHAEFTSVVLRFVDDLELWFDTEAEVVHVRSASRIGYSDLGANRRRVEALRRAFELVAGG